MGETTRKVQEIDPSWRKQETYKRLPIRIGMVEPEPFNANFEGVVRWLKRRHSEADSERQREWIEGYMREVPCSTCEGARAKSLCRWR